MFAFIILSNFTYQISTQIITAMKTHLESKFLLRTFHPIGARIWRIVTYIRKKEQVLGGEERVKRAKYNLDKEVSLGPWKLGTERSRQVMVRDVQYK